MEDPSFSITFSAWTARSLTGRDNDDVFGRKLNREQVFERAEEPLDGSFYGGFGTRPWHGTVVRTNKKYERCSTNRTSKLRPNRIIAGFYTYISRTVFKMS